ncbi:sulfotransferase domain-containing protein [Aurantiacibacter spongiae]|uniref:Sulfotransferase domain-containing protein n=1 Tax=Aurantiacibacter spongiae TaxID=2488860 RepID=A0A3N5DQW3_9SPHN|nr:sulfotransferase domain-containing protein [Aurantiacibacter spongiae]RPF71511.1 sulfotransferase domain-containing protein [Aurantiacibacter spongiae]
MDVRPDDRFLFSYPRSGNTWLRHIVFYALNRDHVTDMERLEQQIPTVDTLEFPARLAKLGDRQRIIKSHLPFAPYFLDGKVVYIVRDGRDTILSYYDYFQHIHAYRGSFDQFLQKALAGRMRYGSWQDNVGSWYGYRDDPNMLLVRYEDMRADPVAMAERILSFCGIDADRAVCEAAVAASDVGKVHKTFQSWNSARGTGFSGGASGGGRKDWRSRMTDDQNAFFQDHAGDLLEQLGYERS